MQQRIAIAVTLVQSDARCNRLLNAGEIVTCGRVLASGMAGLLAPGDRGDVVRSSAILTAIEAASPGLAGERLVIADS